MAWFLRVIETGADQWQCRWGAHTYDEHATRAAAEAHIQVLAAGHRSVRIFVHRLDGSVMVLRDLPDPAGA
jgi:hypothetical protein